MAKMKKCAYCLRRIFGWLLIVLGGLLGASSAVCALVALFGGMELDSFGERLRFFATALMMTAAFFTILWLGIRLKNSGRRNMAAGRVMNPSLPAKKKMQRANNVKVCGKCEKCGEPLHAFHYYRDNACFTYCEKCGNSNLAAFAAPYRTIELNFDGHQREGFSLTVEVEKWPSLEQCYLRWYEWNETGGSDVKVDLPTNYMREHTVEEFLAEYILKENDVTNCIPFSINEGLLRQIRNRLTESGVLQDKRTAYAGKITVQDALNTFPTEEQQRFENQLYQYSQDTGRAGLSPEIAAANRGLVFVDGRPVAKEVAARLDEMRNAVSSDNAADIGQTGQSWEEDVFVLYERNWAGQAAENGVDKIFLKVFEDECVITYERLSRNCYATPPIEDVQTKVRYRLLSTISIWSLEELLLYINRTFHLSINICDCCSEQHYLAWIENHNTEFYSMEIMFDGKKQACMVRRENEKSCEEVRFQGQTYFWKQSKAIHGLWNYDYAVEVCLNEKVYYLYHAEIPSKNVTLCWIVSQITESVFELLKHQPCNNEEIVFEKEIGQISGDEPERRGRIYIVLALATGRTIGYYRADDGTYKICLGRIPETVVPNDNHS